jgi:DNA-binding NtrC family response regulator
LLHVLEKALERSRLVRENLILQKRIRDQESFHEMIGFSPKIQKVFDSIRLISKTDATVLITGESGTGKDLAARAIHGRSSRSSGPYVAVNCPNLPENILESELFGYKKGAFTHATHDKKGLFWEAQAGTIYLDEIGDISLSLQVKLLRVLQEKEIRPLGETKNIKVDVRIVASTNRDLQAKMRENLFREDLFYRLNVLTLQMPALRERREDIPLLANHFLKKFCSEYKLPEKSIHPAAMQRLMNSRWRGNVRELENVISRAVLMSPTNEIQTTDIESIDESPSLECSGISFNNLNYKDAKNQLLERFHHEYLSNLLIRNQGNVTKAAKECGLERQALQQVLKRYSIKAKELHHLDT